MYGLVSILWEYAPLNIDGVVRWWGWWHWYQPYL